MDAPSKKTIWTILTIVGSVSLPFIALFVLSTYVDIRPHSITNMQGRWTLSISLLTSSVIMMIVTYKMIKRVWIKWAIRVPILLLYLPLSFLVLIRSTCESNYWGEVEDESSVSSPATPEKAESSACR